MTDLKSKITALLRVCEKANCDDWTGFEVVGHPNLTTFVKSAAKHYEPALKALGEIVERCDNPACCGTVHVDELLHIIAAALESVGGGV